MYQVNVRVYDDLCNAFSRRAAGANLAISGFLRPLIEDAVMPGGRYVYTTHDKIIGIAIQTFTLLAEITATQSPAALEQGIARGSDVLREPGFLASDHQALLDVNGPRFPATGGVR